MTLQAVPSSTVCMSTEHLATTFRPPSSPSRAATTPLRPVRADRSTGQHREVTAPSKESCATAVEATAVDISALPGLSTCRSLGDQLLNLFDCLDIRLTDGTEGLDWRLGPDALTKSARTPGNCRTSLEIA